MKSSMQMNLRGPLSDVFFSCQSRTPSTREPEPRLTLDNLGGVCWGSPSDVLIGKSNLKPFQTSRTQRALAHRRIVQCGTEIEERVKERHEYKLQEALEKMEQKTQHLVEALIEEALEKDRVERNEVYCSILEQVNADTVQAYEKTLEETLAQIKRENLMRIQECVEETERVMVPELCALLSSHCDQVSQQLEVQLACKKSSLRDNYEDIIKKLQQQFAASKDELQNQYMKKINNSVTQLEAERKADLARLYYRKNKEFQEEIKEVESTFDKQCLTSYIELMIKDAAILKLEEKIKQLNENHELEKIKIKEAFKLFQKSINFVFKEKPAQAEYMLKLEELNEEDEQF